MQMVMYMKVTGKMTKLMAMESITTLMAPDMKGTGKKINNTVMVKKPGLTMLAMKVNIKKAKRMVMENSFGQMDLLTKVSLLIIIFMEWVFIHGQIKDSIMVNG
jgi:hypothetical protein